jgi:hypothetical protein
MSKITAGLLFLEILRKITEDALAQEELRAIYAREFIIHPDGGSVCPLSNTRMILDFLSPVPYLVPSESPRTRRGYQ